MASLLDDSGWASSWTTGSSTSSYLSGSTLAAPAGLLSAGSLGIAQLLGQSYALGSAGQQVLSTGQPASAAADFDYWLEALAI
jgi:hypothetical protein